MTPSEDTLPAEATPVLMEIARAQHSANMAGDEQGERANQQHTARRAAKQLNRDLRGHRRWSLSRRLLKPGVTSNRAKRRAEARMLRKVQKQMKPRTARMPSVPELLWLLLTRLFGRVRGKAAGSS